ncbi:MAG: F0F1 ATP synthase subunit B [Burkholderiales bacterium]
MNINATLIGQSITFFLFVVFCMKYIWPYVMHALEQRRQRIADGLAAGERGRHELELAAKRASENMHEAKQKAAEIITHGEHRAAEIIEQAKAAAKQEGERLLAGAKAQIEQEVSRAKEDLRRQVAGLAVAGAEKILRREVDAKTHADLLQSLAREL